MDNKKGISLIVLVITILVMIILAGVVIVSLQNDNPINKAKYAKTVDSIQSVRNAISQYAATAQASDDVIVEMRKILASEAAAETEGEFELADGATVKPLLGVDPSSLKDIGKFSVNIKTGSSVFTFNDEETMTGLGIKSEDTLPDGIKRP